MDEAMLKSQLMRQFRLRLPTAVALRHEDVRTSGIPDISVTYAKMTTWLEVKYACPRWKSHGIQELTMLRLAAAGSAFYVIYALDGDEKKTSVLHPKGDASFTFEGQYDHAAVVDLIARIHEEACSSSQ